MLYPSEKSAELVFQLDELQKSKHILMLDLHHLSLFLQSESAKTYLLEGLLRRYGNINRCADRVFSLYPPTQKTLASQDDLADVAIFIQGFLINVYGLLDNIAWVCAMNSGMSHPITQHERRTISLFSKAITSSIPRELSEYLSSSTFTTWYETYAKTYRDSLVHRIAPYIPPSMLTDAEQERFKRLDIQEVAALKSYDFELAENLRYEKFRLGSPAPYYLLSLSEHLESEPPVLLHPQIICDLMTIREVLSVFGRSMRDMYGIPAATGLPTLEDL